MISASSCFARRPRHSDVDPATRRDDGAQVTETSDASWARLRRIAAEALILQDAAEALLMRLPYRPELSEVARPGGRLKARFLELRDELPASGDPEVDRYSTALGQILTHHVLMLKASIDLLVCERGSERLADALAKVDGLGAAAERLELLRTELVNRDA